MPIELVPVAEEEKEILRNLLEKYSYEFSQYTLEDVNPLGLYGYSYLDNYWTEEHRWAFFIKAEGHLAGFVMVNNYPEAPDRETDYVLSEFFVLYKYRRKGVGRRAAFSIFDRFPGRWQLKRHPHNLPAAAFWDHTVSAYTCGNYQLVKGYPHTEYADGSLGDVYFFDTSPQHSTLL